jgi:phosphatidylinositol-3-phosphatase
MALVALAVVSDPAAARSAGDPAAQVCGTAAAPPVRVDHIIWIWFENHSFSQIDGSPYAPFFNALAADCGLATNYREVAWTSLPAYLDLTGGSNGGLPKGACEPGPTCQVTNPSLFGQLEQAGLTWRGYAEDMPGNCALTSSGRYDTERNPAVYYVDVQPTCPNSDIPLGTTTAGNLAADLANNTLTTFAYITPNQCNAMEKKCKGNAIANGDAFLRNWIIALTSSAAYQSGDTVIAITFDEPKSKFGPLIYTIVVSPSTLPGTRAADPFTHFSLLRTTEELLGVSPFLGNADSATSMGHTFNLEP